MAEKMGVSDRITFTGGLSRAELINHYARAGALFYGPIGEDYGYATLEAFYSGKPVITCKDSGGVLEFVDADTGWVTENEPRDIGAAIEDALTRKMASRGKGEAGRSRIQYISWDYVLDHLIV